MIEFIFQFIEASIEEELAFREALEPMDYLAQSTGGAVLFTDEFWAVCVRFRILQPEGQR